MASKPMLVTIAIAAAVAVLLNVAEAREFMVGEDQGWKPGVNYTAWAAGKEFFVGDSIAFMYENGTQNVIKVSGPEFQSCTVPANAEPLTSGKDVITLAQPGKKWYICGLSGHCKAGQKLVINVKMSAGSPAPLPPPLPAPSSPQTGAGSTISPYYAILFAASAFSMKVFFM